MRTINNWKPEVSSLINRLRKNKCLPLKVCDGEEVYLNPSIKECVDVICGVDEGWLKVSLPDGSIQTLFLVLGNEPGVIVSDYTCHPLLDKVTEEHYESWEGRKQPTLTVD